MELEKFRNFEKESENETSHSRPEQFGCEIHYQLNNIIVELYISRFVSIPMSSGIGCKNCKSTASNTSKDLNFSDKFSTNHNKFSFNIYNTCNSKHLRVEYINIRSVLNKVESLENYLSLIDIDLFFLTETW